MYYFNRKPVTRYGNMFSLQAEHETAITTDSLIDYMVRARRNQVNESTHTKNNGIERDLASILILKLACHRIFLAVHALIEPMSSFRPNGNFMHAIKNF